MIECMKIKESLGWEENKKINRIPKNRITLDVKAERIEKSIRSLFYLSKEELPLFAGVESLGMGKTEF